MRRPGAGIGGDENEDASGAVAVSGGTVHATGGTHGAGIGTGYECTPGLRLLPTGPISVTGGTVVARGSGPAAGLGGGNCGGAGTVDVTGGTVTAYSGSANAAGVGGGVNGPEGTVSIGAQGTLTAVGPPGYTGTTAIGGHWGGPSGSGSLTNAGHLTIPSGSALRVRETRTVTNSGTITNGGRLAGLGTITNSGSIVGDGQVESDGVGPAGTSLLVEGHNHLVGFDTGVEEVAAPSAVRLYAPSFQDAGLELPTPTRAGYQFDGWVTSTTLAPVAADTPLGTAFDQAGPADVTLLATWTAEPQPPTVGSVVPDQGSIGGFSMVTLSGSGFTGATGVTFGGTPGTDVTVVDDSTIQVRTPAQAAGAVDVVVLHPLGDGTAAGAFTYLAPPTLSSLSPTSGPTDGGTVVEVTGTGFTEDATVLVDGATVTPTYESATELSFVTPAHAGGTVGVSVVTAGGTTGPASFTYGTVPPVVTGLLPTSGPMAGGTAITITGADLSDVTTVTVGESVATDVEVVSETEVRAVTSSSGYPGQVPVRVADSAGTYSEVSDQAWFTYIDPRPVITGVSPDHGPVSGGTTVQITGRGFTGATKVRFGDTAAASYEVLSDNLIEAVSPVRAGGTVRIVIKLSATVRSAPVRGRQDRFTFARPTVTNLLPRSGPVTGGTEVTIRGVDLPEGARVWFGEAEGTVVSASATEIVVTTPRSAGRTLGAVPLRVTTADGAVAAPGTRKFTYLEVRPEISAITPASGALAGGDEVLIVGDGLAGANDVVFGTQVATVLEAENGRLLVRTPAGLAAGSVQVRVRTPYGRSPKSDSTRFTYLR